MSTKIKDVLTDDDLMERWVIGSRKIIAQHRARGLKGFRVAFKADASKPGPSLWRYHLRDVEIYEDQLKAESVSLPKPEPAPVQAIAGWDGVDRLGAKRPRPRRVRS